MEDNGEENREVVVEREGFLWDAGRMRKSTRKERKRHGS